MPTPLTEGHGRSTGLVDVLDRVLDKGLVVAGDVKVSLAEVELSPGRQQLSAENEELRKQVRALERQIASLTRRRSAPALK
jgi:cell division protein FtsB